MVVQPTIADLREKCGGCGKNILTHQRISVCDLCSNLSHAKCVKNTLTYNFVNDVWTCKKCLISQQTRYNPFMSHSNSTNKAGTDPVCENSDIHDIRNILNSCNYYTADKVGSLLSNEGLETNRVSILFNNLDGNATNFDQFWHPS